MGPIRFSFGLVNAYLLRGARGDVLVDTWLPGLSGRLLRLLARHGSGPDRLALIILTHVHIDHVGGLAGLLRLTGAPVLVHRSEAQTLEEGRVVLPAGQTLLAHLLMGAGALLCPRRITGARPDIIVDAPFSLAPFGIDGRVIHTPAHTSGSLSVLLGSGDAVIGDLCQNGWFYGMGMGPLRLPLADLPDAWAPSCRRLLTEGALRFHPGHGEPFDAAALRARLP